MEITVFKELTTSNILAEFATKAAEYDGLYVDMSDAKQRKFVKGQAKEINDLMKKLDRARIDKKADSNKRIEDEHARIVESLAKSNAPFSLLIDDYKAECKRILDEEKALQKLKDDYFQAGIDHQSAIDENELFDLRKLKAISDRAEAMRLAEIDTLQRIEQAKIDAVALVESQLLQANESTRIAEIKRLEDIRIAKQQEINKQERAAEKAKQDAIDAENNVVNQRAVMTQVKESIMACDPSLTEEQARNITLGLKNRKIFNTSIAF